MDELPRYTEAGFAPASLGGLAIHLVTDQGYFYVFGIKGDLAELDFYYSPDGRIIHDEINYTKGYEIDIDFEKGTYDRLKLHLQQTVRELGLDEKAQVLYAEWLREMETPAPPPSPRREPKQYSPETQKNVLALFGLDDED